MVFPFSKYTSIPPYSAMLGYNRTITRSNCQALFNIGPGAGVSEGKRELKSNSLLNTFDDDCSWRGYTLST